MNLFQTFKLLVALLLCISLSACVAYRVPAYTPSENTAEAIKKATTKPLAVSTFTARPEVRKAITCRAAGDVQTVDQSRFESYLEKALIDELKLAGAYDADSPIVVQGQLEQINFSSGMTDANWSLRLTLSSKTNPGYTTEVVYPFDSFFIGELACQQTAMTFWPAAQKLIYDAINDPRFKQLAGQ